MKYQVPQIVRDVGFDFHWDAEKVWQLDEPVVDMDINELVWHFDIPFLFEGTKAVSSRDILNAPKAHPNEYRRMLNADISHPIDIMENKGRWLILDGLHRLMRLYADGASQVKVRIIPRSRIPEITK